MVKKMDAEEFEELESRYGVDLDAWPDDIQLVARTFLNSSNGKRFSAERERLDKLWNESDQAFITNEGPFLDTLYNIPENYAQDVSYTGVINQSFWQILLDMKFLFSPKGFAAQAAFAIAILMVGVIAGAQGLFDSSYGGEVDISTEYFASWDYESDWDVGDSLWN